MFLFPNRRGKNLRAIFTPCQSLHKLKCIYCPVPNSYGFIEVQFQDFGSFYSTGERLSRFSTRDNRLEPKVMVWVKKRALRCEVDLNFLPRSLC